MKEIICILMVGIILFVFSSCNPEKIINFFINTFYIIPSDEFSPQSTKLPIQQIKRLYIEDFPLIVANDCNGGDIFLEGRNKYCKL